MAGLARRGFMPYANAARASGSDGRVRVRHPRGQEPERATEMSYGYPYRPLKAENARIGLKVELRSEVPGREPTMKIVKIRGDRIRCRWRQKVRGRWAACEAYFAVHELLVVPPPTYVAPVRLPEDIV